MTKKPRREQPLQRIIRQARQQKPRRRAGRNKQKQTDGNRRGNVYPPGFRFTDQQRAEKDGVRKPEWGGEILRERHPVAVRQKECDFEENKTGEKWPG